MPDVLIATDAAYVLDEVQSALDGPGSTWRVARNGQLVVPACRHHAPDLAVLDLQVGNMGGVAVCHSLRLELSAGRLPRIPVLLLLDRAADVFLARRCDADGWLIKPFDSLRLRRAADAVMAGGTWHEGVPTDQDLPAAAQ